MTDTEKMNKIKKLIEKLSSKNVKRYEDDFCSVDYGNYDDCWDMGMRDGRIELSKEIMEIINK